jgi:small GTP-binding protein
MSVRASPSQEKVKVVFIGDSEVGKSALFTRFQRRPFQPGAPSTVGGACANISVQMEGQQTIDMIIWDTAGQEKYRGIIPMYFSRCAFILIVYDISNRQSFEGISDWYQLSRDKAPDVAKVILIGNKSDLPERAVSIAEGTEFASSIGAHMFFETSAMTGDGVEEVILSVASTAWKEASGFSELLQPSGVVIEKIGSPENRECC